MRPWVGLQAPDRGEHVRAQGRELTRDAPPGAAAPSAAGASVVALAPADGGRTVAEHSVLLWFRRQGPDRDVEFRLKLVDEHTGETRGDVRLARPTQPGVQRIRLRDHGLRLAPGTVYRWTLSVRQGTATVPLTSGLIERVEVPPALAAAVAAARPAAQPGLYADAGFWYDALALLDELHERYPQNASAREAFASLLEQGGLAQVAQALRQ